MYFQFDLVLRRAGDSFMSAVQKVRLLLIIVRCSKYPVAKNSWKYLLESEIAIAIPIPDLSFRGHSFLGLSFLDLLFRDLLFRDLLWSYFLIFHLSISWSSMLNFLILDHCFLSAWTTTTVVWFKISRARVCSPWIRLRECQISDAFSRYLDCQTRWATGHRWWWNCIRRD